MCKGFDEHDAVLTPRGEDLDDKAAPDLTLEQLTKVNQRHAVPRALGHLTARN